MNLKITLANAVELVAENIISTTASFQGASRKALEFVFSENEYTMDYLKSMFTAANCETILVNDVGIPGVETQTATHAGYVLQVGVREESIIDNPGDEDNAPTYKRQVHVIMAKHTYEENKYKKLQDSVDKALLLALDALD